MGGDWKVCIGGGGGVRDLDGVIVEYAIGLLIRRDVVGLFRKLLGGCGGRCRGGVVVDIIATTKCDLIFAKRTFIYVSLVAILVAPLLICLAISI